MGEAEAGLDGVIACNRRNVIGGDDQVRALRVVMLALVLGPVRRGQCP